MTKKQKEKSGIKFPCGTLEEMLRMMRECRKKGNTDCEERMKNIMGKEFHNIDVNKMKTYFFENSSKKFSFEELMKKCRKR